MSLSGNLTDISKIIANPHYNNYRPPFLKVLDRYYQNRAIYEENYIFAKNKNLKKQPLIFDHGPVDISQKLKFSKFLPQNSSKIYILTFYGRNFENFNYPLIFHREKCSDKGQKLKKLHVFWP